MAKGALQEAKRRVDRKPTRSHGCNWKTVVSFANDQYAITCNTDLANSHCEASSNSDWACLHDDGNHDSVPDRRADLSYSQ